MLWLFLQQAKGNVVHQPIWSRWKWWLNSSALPLTGIVAGISVCIAVLIIIVTLVVVVILSNVAENPRVLNYRETWSYYSNKTSWYFTWWWTVMDYLESSDQCLYLWVKWFLHTIIWIWNLLSVISDYQLLDYSLTGQPLCLFFSLNRTHIESLGNLRRASWFPALSAGC